MKKLLILIAACVLSASAAAQEGGEEDLKIFALEALIAAPPERAFPIVSRVLNGTGSTELKSRALFVLSQMDHPESLPMLMEAVRSGDQRLSREAIRMIGINGDPDALRQLRDMYPSADAELRRSILEAYLIAGDTEAVYQLALNADSPEAFDRAVEVLGNMGAKEELRLLRDRAGSSQPLIHALAHSGDVETLSEMAADPSDSDRQLTALRALGIAGGPEVDQVLVQAYRATESPEVKQAALEGMMVAGYDEGVLELFRASTDSEEKRQLLRTLTIMDSEAVWEIIDQTLDGGE